MKEKVAFRFSKKLGMLDADNLSGEPYYISIVNQETLPPMDPKGKEKKKTDGVIYNIPGKAQVTVFTPNKRYFDGELPVTQFGTTECLIDNLFNKKVNTRVIFNPNTGGIVKIDKDQNSISPLHSKMKVCQNAHLLFFTHKAPTFTSWGFVIT